MLAELSAETFSILAVGSFVAGLIDAIVGGGGLVLIPLILIVAPATPEASAMATNKLAAVFGTSSAAARMLRSSDIRQKIDRKLVAYGVPLAFVCAASGALLVAALSTEVLRPLVIFLLLAVGTYVALKPSFGTPQRAPAQSRRRWLIALFAVGAIATYDGFFGPGTGTFLIIVFTALLSRSFVESAALAKIINIATNLGALTVFAIGGHVLWPLGLGLAVFNVAGAQVGARLVLSKGTGFVRIALLVVVVIMSSKLGYDMYTSA